MDLFKSLNPVIIGGIAYIFQVGFMYIVYNLDMTFAAIHRLEGSSKDYGIRLNKTNELKVEN